MTRNPPIRPAVLGESLRVQVFPSPRRDELIERVATFSIVVLGGPAHVALLDVSHVPTLARSVGASPEAKRVARQRLDAALDAMSGLEIPTLVLVGDEGQARAAIGRGAHGAVRHTDWKRTRAALEAVAAGLGIFDVALAPKVGEPTALTAREREVLELLVEGLSNRRIAKRLAISEHTAKFHVNGILLKLGASTRTEAVVHAARAGLVAL